jgi:hypothetical protein
MFAKFGPIVMGIPLLLIGLAWVFDPGIAAGLVQSELQSGSALSTQIGDSVAFFLGAGYLLIVGGLKQDRTMVLIGGCLIGLVAPARVLAATVHGGALTLDLIVIELITLAVAVLAARSMKD